MKKRSLSECWLWLGIFALAVAGLYALVPVIGRTPQLQALPVVQHLFDVALVVHVDLSILVWFLCMICLGASRLTEDSAPEALRFMQRAGWAAMAFATVLMTLSPLGAWVPVKSNYIPVLHNMLFLTSLGVLTAGLILALAPAVLFALRPSRFRALHALDLAYLAASVTVLLSLVGYFSSGSVRAGQVDLLQHYEVLFWTGGHMMQFAYALLAVAAWLVLLQAMGGKLPGRLVALVLYAIPIVGALLTLHASKTAEYGYFFDSQTQIMIEWGSTGATIMALMIIYKFCRLSIRRETRAYTAALFVSLILFFFGGVLGLMIQGQNVTIPAHYHGIITGITQGLMGMAYVMLPRFGYQSVAATRLAFWQPIIYGLGQLMHIGGLAYCGGYGILRKTAGGFEHLAPDIKIALGIFGLGGLLAITGGILFVVVMLRVRRPSASPQQAVL